MKFKIRGFKEKSSKWLLLSATALTIGLSSCEKEKQFLELKTNDITSLDAKNAQGENIYDSQSENQRIFGKALLEAMKKSPALRTFIKKEALKKFNHDYDVLFATVKHTVIEDGKTFRDIMLENVASEEVLKQIELTNPLLTIFVPSLPENSFSAETWDTENEIPDVALRLHTTNDVPCFGAERESYVIEAPYIPSYPIVVVKQNERVTSSLTKGYEIAHIQNPFTAVDGVEYKFMDKVYDNRRYLYRDAYSAVNYENRNIEPEVEEAYNIYRNANGWHRDYIYYGITPTTPNGRYTLDFQERITYFKLDENNGSATGIYNYIADQSGSAPLEDPTAQVSQSSAQASFWTDGGFEFKLAILINADEGAELPKAFMADPEQLFNIVYSTDGILFFPYKIHTKAYNPNLEIFDWDIQSYGTSIRINIEEQDRTELKTKATSKSSEFATNFGLDVDNVFKKLGLEFGLSAKITRTDNMSVSYTEGSDDMSNVIVNFADDIIVRSQYIPTNGGIMLYKTREYSSNFFTISVEPVRVQSF